MTDMSQFRTPRKGYEHTKSYEQDKPLGHGENFQALLRGAKQWVPDIPGSIGDLVDMAYVGGRNVLQGQKQRSVAPLGLGAALRRAVSRPAPREQTELTDPETSGWEEAARFLNPFMLNPQAALRVGALGLVSGAAHGVSPAIVKPRGGNWMTGPGSELESALEYLQKGDDAGPLNKWIQGPLKKYIQRDMATEADPIRKLLEQDRPVSHIPLDQILANSEQSWIGRKAQQHRKAAGMPSTDVSKSGYGQAWENIADAFVGNNPAHTFNYGYPPEHPMSAEWVKKLPPETPIHDFVGDEAADFMGLPHLVDELHNASRLDSDLPQHLRLMPEQLQQIGIEKAVRHVADINSFRANQKAEAAKKMLQGPGVIPVREYAENNPKGLRWVELGGKEKEPLQKQLRYEGDTMGHCVGGYCEDVLGGQSRIFSLRDAKGEPHVTIETAPQGLKGDWLDWADKYMGTDEFNKLEEAAFAKHKENEKKALEEISNLIIARPDFQEWASARPAIVQIKGKQNRAPKSEYVPFIKDFLTNPHHGGTWYDDIGDIGTLNLSSEDIAKIPVKGFSKGGLVGKQDFDGITGYILE